MIEGAEAVRIVVVETQTVVSVVSIVLVAAPLFSEEGRPVAFHVAALVSLVVPEDEEKSDPSSYPDTLELPPQVHFSMVSLFSDSGYVKMA